MKLLEYKPEIKFIAWDKIENKMIYDNEVSGYLNYIFAGYTDDSGCSKIRSEILLPYTNCKDKDGNKLYLFDVINILDKKVKISKYYLIIFRKGRYQVKHLTKCGNGIIKNVSEMFRFKRLGSIYELPEIQKQFNIEV